MKFHALLRSYDGLSGQQSDRTSRKRVAVTTAVVRLEELYLPSFSEPGQLSTLRKTTEITGKT